MEEFKNLVESYKSLDHETLAELLALKTMKERALKSPMKCPGRESVTGYAILN